MQRRDRERIKATEFTYIPVVLGSNANALGIVRSLGERNLPVLVADSERGIAFYSRYAIPVIIESYTSSSEGFLKSLNRIATFLHGINKKGLLYCSSDAYLFAVGENIIKLRGKYKIIFDNWDRVKGCLDKSFLYQEAERLHIPYPKTFYAKSSEELITIKDLLQYPILIKPAITVGFSEVYKKAIVVEDEEQLGIIRDEINSHGLGDHELILQELIPGPVENLYTFSSYSDYFGDVKAYSIGHKIRQTPPEAGIITAGRVIHRERLANLGIKFIKGLKYHGIANTEFKFDTRDRKYKLIEINPRPGLWNYSATAAGVNLSWIAYQDIALGVKSPVKYSRRKLVWIYDLMDLSRAVFSKQYGHDKTRVSLLRWMRSVHGERTYAIWQAKDPGPFLYFLISLLRKGIK